MLSKVRQRYIPGDRWVECEDCGFAYRYSEMRKGKDEKQKGFDICPKCFDPPHPLDDKPKPRTPKPLPEVK